MKAAGSSGKLTIGDLARHLGVSKGTVSRALSGYPDISQATKDRVLKAANELGYRPSSYAQSLKTGSAKSVALIFSVTGDTVQAASLPELLDGISWRLGEDNWTLTVATASSDQTDLDLQLRLIEEKKVDGFIIPRTKYGDARITLMHEHDMPFVLYGRTDAPENAAWFDVETETAMKDAVIRLTGLGHTRIGYIGTDAAYYMSGLREGGYKAGLSIAGLTFDPELARANGMSLDSGRVNAHSLLSLPEPPTAIVCAMDAAALGAYRAIAALGLEVGRDVSVVGYDGIPEGRYVSPKLTTFANDSRQAGVVLADLLLRRLRGEATEMLRVTRPAELVEGGSDGPPQKTSEELAAKIAASKKIRKREVT